MTDAALFLDALPSLAAAPLVRLGFGTESGPDAAFRVPLTSLGGPAGEAWHGAAAGPVRVGEHQGIAFRENGQWLCAALHIADAEDAEAAAFEAYSRLREFLAARPYPQLVRVWNYLDRLNHGEGDTERYRRFCVGRHRAIAEPGFEATLPAATVIGSLEPGLRLSFVAGCTPGQQIENPRQTSAFLYPRQYGPVSPSFSRATLVGRTLLVSGTAAVVGHLTLHAGDARAQAREVGANLQALLQHAADRHFHGEPGRWRAQSVRVYLRDPQDRDAVQALLPTLGPDVPVAVMQGDISRTDLMIEAEGVWVFEPLP